MATINVLLICGSGASSGFMANSIRKAAKKRDLDIQVKARSDSELEQHLEGTAVVLVGPHLKYMEKELQERVANYGIQVAIIDQAIYGRLDGDKGLDLVLKLLETK
ncbi:PTS sugar transporter subunit IIB [Paenibacillus phocaensis]|uniref:PTS sugar transporter subunit IIB n=1 Tax=Paenibacillus phocaensis TaxID=1776378 RepID=UPI0003A175A4|nr:PTS sugar transporter subunit IIB [Paenibacillus phocaensis]